MVDGQDPSDTCPVVVLASPLLLGFEPNHQPPFVPGGSNRHVVDRTADMDGDEARRRAAKQAKAGVRAADKLGAVLLVAAAAAAWMYARGGDERRAQGSDKQADEALHHKETSP